MIRPVIRNKATKKEMRHYFSTKLCLTTVKIVDQFYP